MANQDRSFFGLTSSQRAPCFSPAQTMLASCLCDNRNAQVAIGITPARMCLRLLRLYTLRPRTQRLL